MFDALQAGAFPDGDQVSLRLQWIRDNLAVLGQVPLPGAGRTGQRLRALAHLAGADGSLSRLAEGHLDALAIRDELGAGPPDDGEVWAVWAAQPGLLAAEPRAGGWRLCGQKPWCSGADGVDRALVTATDPEGGVRLFQVAVTSFRFADDWRAVGMRASDSRTGSLDVAVEAGAELGPVGGYVGRSGFWHGGVGVAACWHGLADRLAADLAAFAGQGDPYARESAGRAAAAVASSAALLAAAARQIDGFPDDVLRARHRAQLVRVAVAGSAEVVLDTSVRAQGAGALCFDPVHARAVTDLMVYLRQLHHGRDAAAVEVPVADDWWSS